MSEKTVADLDAWRMNALESWDDHRIVDRLWVDLHIWLFLHSYADLAQSSLVLYGLNFRESPAGWLLVVKVRQGEVPLVGFISGKNPTSCIRQFRECVRNDKMKWSRDKYA